MKQIPMLFLFLTGITHLVHSVEHKYYVVQQQKTWYDALAYCRATYTDLAIIYSDADMIELQAEAQRQQFTSDAWVGLYKVLHGWRWSYEDEPLGPLAYWSPGSNVGQNRDECVFMYYNGAWADQVCTETYNFLCYDESNIGSRRYVYITSPKTWQQAQSYCRLYHTDLASVRTRMENSILNRLINIRSWIGLYRTTWKWLGQDNQANIDWMPGQPDNLQGYENCGYLSQFQAEDDQCTNMRPFFCLQVLPDRSQIMRFKVQSDQNLNDPPVNGALLMEVMQKLKEHDMDRNVTLKWRKQPGGEIFHKIEDTNNSGNK